MVYQALWGRHCDLANFLNTKTPSSERLMELTQDCPASPGWCVRISCQNSRESHQKGQPKCMTVSGGGTLLPSRTPGSGWTTLPWHVAPPPWAKLLSAGNIKNQPPCHSSPLFVWSRWSSSGFPYSWLPCSRRSFPAGYQIPLYPPLSPLPISTYVPIILRDFTVLFLANKPLLKMHPLPGIPFALLLWPNLLQFHFSNPRSTLWGKIYYPCFTDDN